MMLANAYPGVIVAITIWREARGEPWDAQRAVAWVIYNRMRDKRWPDDPVGVCHQRLQFSCWNSNDPNFYKWPAAADPSWLSCCKAWQESGGDPTSGANHYHSFSDTGDFPAWADASKITAKIGSFTFYKL